MNTVSVATLLEDAIEAAADPRRPVAVRARLALASKALEDGRDCDVVEHLTIAFRLTPDDDVSGPIGNALQLAGATEKRGEGA